MTPPPDFEEIVGADVEAAERARLARVHSLLVQAGPPPELSPELESGPTLGMTLARRPARVRRRVMLLAAAVAIVALAFLGGYIAGNGGGTASAEVLKLTGTPAAPRAFASLQVEPVDAGGNWPMRLSIDGHAHPHVENTHADIGIRPHQVSLEPGSGRTISGYHQGVQRSTARDRCRNDVSGDLRRNAPRLTPAAVRTAVVGVPVRQTSASLGRPCRRCSVLS